MLVDFGEHTIANYQFETYSAFPVMEPNQELVPDRVPKALGSKEPSG
jgi:hypothetical protein